MMTTEEAAERRDEALNETIRRLNLARQRANVVGTVGRGPCGDLAGRQLQSGEAK